MSDNINPFITDYIETMSKESEIELLQSIDLSLKAISRKDGLVISQSSLKDMVDAERQADRRSKSSYRRTDDDSNTAQPRRNRYRGSDDWWSSDSDYMKRKMRKSIDKITDELEDSFASEFKKALFGSANPLQDALADSIKDFADKLDTNVDELGKTVGEKLGKIAGEAFKKSKFGDRLTREMQSVNNFISDGVSDLLDFGADFLNGADSVKGKGFGDILDMGMNSLKSNAQKNFGSFSSNLSDIMNLFKGGSGSAAEAAETILSGGAGSAEVFETAATITDAATGATEAVGAIVEGGASMEAASTALGTLGAEAATAGTGLAVVGAEAGTGLAAAGAGAAAAGAAFPVLGIAIIAATVLVDKLSETLGPAIDGFKSFTSSLKAAATRDITSNERRNQEEKKRRQADAEALTRAAYDVIEKSANRVTEVWDRVLSTITTSQGYDKAGVQTLWSNYAKILKEEGLSSVISSADIMEQLQGVLNKGLSGAVAESFAYQATILNNAMPTEDFFQYAETYASIAANAMKNGASQEEAIALANDELRSFASNLLYASREIAGGFTTSLTGASSLFEDAAKITIASHSSLADVSDISAVLTSVSGIVGAIAPDVAESIVSAVVSAATGGNSSELTALRSMAGVGASNTAFLQALAKDPKGVFTELFTNLAQLQGMSSSNYMEVAEALSSVFGLSIDAFSRVDFNYLAKAIDKMNLDSKALEDNMKLLKAGDTTSTDEQLRMQQINAYMIDEGLAYVLDNEVARSIQQHMWDEQLANEIMETEFSVNVVGGLLDLVTGIQNTVQQIINLTPFGLVKQGINLVLTAVEGIEDTFDRAGLLVSGVVGKGTTTGAFKELYNLTSMGKEYLLTGKKNAYYDWYTGLNGFDTNSENDRYYTRKIVGKSVAKASSELWKQYSHEYNVYREVVEPVKTASVSIAKAATVLGNGAVSAANTLKGSALLTSSISTLSTQANTQSSSKEKSTKKSEAQTAKSSAEALKAAKKILTTSTVTLKELSAGHITDWTKALKDVKEDISDAKQYLKTAKSLEQSKESKTAIKEATKSINTMETLVKQLSKSNPKDAQMLVTELQALAGNSEKARDQIKEAIQTSSKVSTKNSKESKEATDKAIEKAVKLTAAEQQQNRQKANELAVLSAIELAQDTVNKGQATFKSTAKELSKAIEASYESVTDTTTNNLADTLRASIEAYAGMVGDSSSIIDSLRTTIKDTNALDLLSSDREELQSMIDAAEAAGKAGQYAGIAHRSFLTQSELEDALQATPMNKGSFADWVAQIEQVDSVTGKKKYNLTELLSQYGATLADLEAIYNEAETAKSSATSKAREIHEVQFWEDMQHFATIDFPWYMREWERYYIQHEAYTTASNEAYTKATQLKAEEQGELGDSVLALARALTENDMWKEGMEEIKDPVLHTNVLLSKILLTVEAIMQQNNDTSIVSIPTALSSLGLGSSNL